jgi:S-DNA-T family DNA segregation ATPase FtsK/SpoIIIE
MNMLPGIARRKQQVDIRKEKILQAKARINALISHGQQNARNLWSYYEPYLIDTQRTLLTYLNDKPLEVWAGWDESSWSAWNPTSFNLESLIRVGEGVESYAEIGQHPQVFCKMPILLPFIGGQKAIIIHSQGRDSNGLELLQSLIVRTCVLLPLQARYTFIDPYGAGRAFPMRRSLLSMKENSVRENTGDLYRDLEKVNLDIQRIMETYIDMETTSFELLPEDIRANENFEFIFAADFPNGYERREIERLYRIANSGAPAGKYVFIHYNDDYELPRDMGIEAIKNAIHIHTKMSVPLPKLSHLKLNYDIAPSPSLQTELFNKLSQAKPLEREITWDETVAPTQKDWWLDRADKIIETSIGVQGGRGSLKAWFGVNNEGRPCAHGMMAGMTGSGKSNLYHVMILGLATRYNPEELRLYLIDGKDGVEFQSYRHLPHVEVISLRSSPELSRSILGELLNEKERRNSLFSSNGVKDLPEYRKAGQPGGKLARILLLIDEYQELFEDDRDNLASNQLLQLAQQGRSAGIHMLLGSQRFGAVNMLNQNSIFGNVHLRMAMKMAISDVQSLTEFDRRGKQLILTCDLPGKVVINDNSGDDNSNSTGKVAYLPSERRDQVIHELVVKAHQELQPDQIPFTVVFDGKEQPNLTENPLLNHLLEYPTWLSSGDLATWARKDSHQGGLGMAEWYAAENPHVLWLGQEYSVRGQATILTRRSQNENILFAGGSNPARYGMLAASLASLATVNSPKEIHFSVIDRSMPGSQWSETLSQVCEYVLKPSGFTYQFTKDGKDTSDFINRLVSELDRRLVLGKENDQPVSHLPSIFFVLTDADKINELTRVDDGYGSTDSPLGKELRRLYVEGSSLGIHLIVSFASFGAMKAILDERRGLSKFRHRIALQMSDDESFSFVRSREAARLQRDGQLPISALYLDDASNRSVRFKPYSTETTLSLVEQLQNIGRQLQERRP